MQLKRRRNSLRLKGFDYSRPGGYFVTICTHRRRCTLGEVVDGRMVLSEAGRIVERVWKQMPNLYKTIRVRAIQIMPNHVHGIVEIAAKPRVRSGKGLITQTPTEDWILMKQPGLPLGKIIRAFKAKCRRLIRQSSDASFQWHRNYYDHIIRDDIEWYFIEQYMDRNPLMWELDRDNPETSLVSLDDIRARLQNDHRLAGLAAERLIEHEVRYRDWWDAEPESEPDTA